MKKHLLASLRSKKFAYKKEMVVGGQVTLQVWVSSRGFI